jgi:hypothetical protein
MTRSSRFVSSVNTAGLELLLKRWSDRKVRAFAFSFAFSLDVQTVGRDQGRGRVVFLPW